MSRSSLYKDPRHGKIAGVCAGVANFFGLEIWLVRILVVSATLLGGGFLIILLYIALSLMLEKQPYGEPIYAQEHTIKSKPWEQGKTAKQLLTAIDADLIDVEKKVQELEAYLTSDAYKVNREFNKL
ncbi:envelope stress response membrane protein PspC [Vibrio sp. CAIM 722]|uniref:Envelope stress response membrane protein PspC n=1 Tax=Vibrio eleionomae TaxID=2653505 RepID=A0A7X4LPE8_9VIBR|nr:envelope stress response membrane protein PspC [Vibrio eleionomae]MZI95176.1 envelope stress response membrane protein PspC [Vibrio eleionomae]